jgi:serine phosphatase RsbU (regulator of sigma subunit)
VERELGADGYATQDDTRFKALFSAIDEGYCLAEIIQDHEGRPVDYRFLETNPLFEEMTGLVDAVGRTARELVPDLEQHWVDVYARAALGGERIRFEQGSEAMGRWFDVFTMPLGPPGTFGIVFKDETDRRRAELSLREREEQLRLLAEQEHRTSILLQKALLPDRLVQRPGVEIAARYYAAHDRLEVGGDWYDTFTWGERIGAMVGDVIGHGITSAATMGRLRAGVKALAPLADGSPAALLDALARCAAGEEGTEFATAAAVVLDPSTGTLRYSAAGHPPGIVVAPDGRTTWLDGASSVPFCGVAVEDRPEACVTIQAGATVVLYSDGLIERHHETIDDGLERLEEVLSRLRALPVEELCAALLEEVIGTGSTDDDAVVLCLRPAPSR